VFLIMHDGAHLSIYDSALYNVSAINPPWLSPARHGNLAAMRSHPREKTGRNDPCPCGSGKKYKHCCLSNTPVSISSPMPSDSPWSRQRDASDRITGGLLRVAKREFGEQILDAWEDFNQVPIPEPMEKLPHEISIFNPYLIFEWDPDRPVRRRTTKPKAGAIARSYMQQNGNRLSELELLLLEQAISRPVSFYEVIRSDPGRTVVLRDLLIGEETLVEEHSASKMMRPGDLAYGQIWILPEVATLGRLAPIIIPPDKKVEIVALRAKLRRKIAKRNRDLSAADLVRYTEEIRTVYLDIRDILRTPPQLRNTDGDPYVFHTLTFRIGSAQVAFDALAPLALGFSKEELLDSAEHSDDGTLCNVEFDWIKKGNAMHKTWENTILGHLKISGKTLVVEVNSANRAKKIRQEIEQRLGLHATYLRTEVQTPEEAIEKSKQQKRSRTEHESLEAEDPLLDPETRREFEAQIQEQVEAWIHQEIPALGGLTPLQAVANPDGREIVEALLLNWERRYEGPPAPGECRPDINAVRRLLHLPV